MAAIEPGDVVIDPLCGGGSISIEVSTPDTLGGLQCYNFFTGWAMLEQYLPPSWRLSRLGPSPCSSQPSEPLREGCGPASGRVAMGRWPPPLEDVLCGCSGDGFGE